MQPRAAQAGFIQRHPRIRPTDGHSTHRQITLLSVCLRKPTAETHHISVRSFLVMFWELHGHIWSQARNGIAKSDIDVIGSISVLQTDLAG